MKEQTIESVREELGDREKFQQARLNTHFNKCKKCKSDDYCNLYIIYHYHWIVTHEFLIKFNLGVELAQKEFLEEFESIYCLDKGRESYDKKICPHCELLIKRFKKSLGVKE